MSTAPEKEEKNVSVDVASLSQDEAAEVGSTSSVIYIDPEKEKAAFKKFDKYVVPASFVFMLLCALDRNNVSETSIYRFSTANTSL